MTQGHIALALVVLLGCGHDHDPDTAKEAQKLLNTDKAFSAFSAEQGAAEAFKHYLHKDALQLPAGSLPLRGRNNIYRQMQKTGNDYTMVWEPQEAQVADSGEMGWSWGIYTVHIPTEGDAVELRQGKYLNVWKKDASGKWRVLVDMGNSNPAEN